MQLRDRQYTSGWEKDHDVYIDQLVRKEGFSSLSGLSGFTCPKNAVLTVLFGFFRLYRRHQIHEKRSIDRLAGKL